MGDMIFGQSFNCLDNWGYHPWVKLIFDSVKAGAYMRCVKFWPFLTPYAKYLIPADVQRRRDDQRKMALEKANYRKSINDGREDLISGYLLPDSGVTDQEYRSTVEVLIIAGSETTATLMSGLTYYLLKDAERMTKVKAEVRNTFSSPEQINFVSVNKLPYLLACIDEALRVYPPTPDIFPRNTGPAAEMICGRVVPPWVSSYPYPLQFPISSLSSSNTYMPSDRRWSTPMVDVPFESKLQGSRQLHPRALVRWYERIRGRQERSSATFPRWS